MEKEKKIKVIKNTLLVLFLIFLIGMLIPQNLKMPVEGAGSHSYNHQTFWYEGWGTSIVHKGVDIFAKKGTPIRSSVYGIVVGVAEYGKGGKFVLVLGPKWRIHYFAHCDEIKTHIGAFVSPNTIIGTVGNTGNAKTTPAHLHYGIGTLVPYLWRIDTSPLGWQKSFYLNPIDYLK